MKKLVYLYDTKSEIKLFIKKINNGEGIPKSPQSITQSYCQYEIYNEKFYVEVDEVIKKYEEKDPIEIEIEFEEPENINQI